MKIVDISLLPVKKYKKYKDLIPLIDDSCWWLQTAADDRMGVYMIDQYGELDFDYCDNPNGDIRPVCLFEFDATDNGFWCKPKKLVGLTLPLGRYSWTILDAKGHQVYAICNKIISRRHFDYDTNNWDESELKEWLVRKGIRLITT
jgi:hypothetical protein